MRILEALSERERVHNLRANKSLRETSIFNFFYSYLELVVCGEVAERARRSLALLAITRSRDQLVPAGDFI